MPPTRGPSTRTTRIIRASPDETFAAFTDPDRLLRWLPPQGMTARLHAFDARAGGGYEMSLFYPESEAPHEGKSAAGEDRVRVRFLEMEPPRRLLESVHFLSDDPAFAGEMGLEVTIDPVPEGVEVCMLFTNLPAGLTPADNDAGARMSLDQLARLLEPR